MTISRFTTKDPRECVSWPSFCTWTTLQKAGQRDFPIWTLLSILSKVEWRWLRRHHANYCPFKETLTKSLTNQMLSHWYFCIGRALLWPSVLNDQPNQKDPRTFHEALPVIKVRQSFNQLTTTSSLSDSLWYITHYSIKGVKYGANGWYHEKDFKTPYSKNCS